MAGDETPRHAHVGQHQLGAFIQPSALFEFVFQQKRKLGLPAFAEELFFLVTKTRNGFTRNQVRTVGLFDVGKRSRAVANRRHDAIVPAIKRGDEILEGRVERQIEHSPLSPLQRREPCSRQH